MVDNSRWYNIWLDIRPIWESLEPLIIAGFAIGVVFAIVFGAIKIGWRFAPYVFIGAMMVWILQYLDT
tara:strand:- start:1808 stop:2011 length:204 start_codon:yes stop_codon:yes gene_type:complete